MDNITIVCDIICSAIWGAIFGMNINEPGIIKWVDAACSVCFAAAAICGVLGI